MFIRVWIVYTYWESRIRSSENFSTEKKWKSFLNEIKTGKYRPDYKKAFFGHLSMGSNYMPTDWLALVNKNKDMNTAYIVSIEYLRDKNFILFDGAGEQWKSSTSIFTVEAGMGLIFYSNSYQTRELYNLQFQGNLVVKIVRSRKID